MIYIIKTVAKRCLDLEPISILFWLWDSRKIIQDHILDHLKSSLRVLLHTRLCFSNNVNSGGSNWGAPFISSWESGIVSWIILKVKTIHNMMEGHLTTESRLKYIFSHIETVYSSLTLWIFMTQHQVWHKVPPFSGGVGTSLLSECCASLSEQVILCCPWDPVCTINPTVASSKAPSQLPPVWSPPCWVPFFVTGWGYRLWPPHIRLVAVSTFSYLTSLNFCFLTCTVNKDFVVTQF